MNESTEWIARGLTAYAERLEHSLRTAQMFVGAASAFAILRIVARFFPDSIPTAERTEGPTDADLAQYLVGLSRPTLGLDAAFAESILAATSEFKLAVSQGDYARAVAALEPTGILRLATSPRDELQRMAFVRTQREWVDSLPRRAKLSLWIGDGGNAESYAAEALRRASPLRPDASDDNVQAVHDAHMVLGVLALRAGDVERAVGHLASSASAIAALSLRRSELGEFRTFGPNYSLAYELLSYNHYRAVLSYLMQCRRVWPSQRMEQWIRDLRAGRRPEFDPILLTH